MRVRLPGRSRSLAGLLLGLLIAGFATLLNGPWLRVTAISWSGEQFTPSSAVAAQLDELRGENLLLVDGVALGQRIAELPAVAQAHVELRLPNAVTVTIVERSPAFVWETTAARLVATADGTVMARLPLDVELDDALIGLPRIVDERAASADLTIGDRIPSASAELALDLHGFDPARLGSEAEQLSVRIDDEYGFVLVSADPPWQASLGFHGMDPAETTSVAERLERQATAIRTLFATRPETQISWVDARNPMRVYFRATDG